MKPASTLLALLLTGCGASPEMWMPASAAVTIGSVAVLGRTPADAAISLLSGKDCSAVRLDQGKSYCRTPVPPPDDPPFCTRSLGVVDCWLDPSAVPGSPRGVADGPSGLTAAQEADRTKGWLF